MQQNQSFGLLRFFERVGLLFLIGGPLVLIVWYIELSTLPLSLVGMTLGSALVGLFTFIYTNKRIGRKIDLLASQSDFAINAQFLALFERSPVPYIIIDDDGKITKINQVAVKLLNAPVADLMGTNLLGRFADTEELDASIVVNKIKAGITLNDIEVPIKQKTGELVWVLLSSYTNPHNTESFISLVDITQAKKVDVAKSEFLALATHQLRTPIAAIRWNTELLAKRIPNPYVDSTGRYVDKIKRNTDRMSALIDDFLNVSKLELGTFATEPKEIMVSSFLGAIVDEFTQRLHEKNITLHREEEPADAIVVFDERLLHIVVSNLMSNASKYVRESGNIWLSTNLQNNTFYIQVKDDGIGVPKDEIEKLFTKFYRASNASKHQAEGTGLGLYVIEQAIDLMGGSIELESDQDQGASFLVTLPLRSTE